jgi:hypothetical protein
MVSPSQVRLLAPPSTAIITFRGTRVLRRDSRNVVVADTSERIQRLGQPMNTILRHRRGSAATQLRRVDPALTCPSKWLRLPRAQLMRVPTLACSRAISSVSPVVPGSLWIGAILCTNMRRFSARQSRMIGWDRSEASGLPLIAEPVQKWLLRNRNCANGGIDGIAIELCGEVHGLES